MPGYLRRARREPTLLRLDDADVVDPCSCLVLYLLSCVYT